MEASGIAKREGGKLFLEEHVRLVLAIKLLELEADIVQVSKHITWRDFEALGGVVLSHWDYFVQRNLRLSRPRMEIDLVGIKGSLGIAVDCKHWIFGGGGKKLEKAARDQVRRVKAYSESTEARRNGVSDILPVILTLLDEGSEASEGVPIVPISRFEGFLQDVEGYLDQFAITRVEQSGEPLFNP